MPTETVGQLERPRLLLERVQLLHQRPVLLRYEPERPHRHVPEHARRHGAEGELAPPVGRHHLAQAAPSETLEPVPPTEPGPDLRSGRRPDPLAPVALGAPLAHPGHVGDEVVDGLGLGADEPLCCGHPCSQSAPKSPPRTASAMRRASFMTARIRLPPMLMRRTPISRSRSSGGVAGRMYTLITPAASTKARSASSPATKIG